MVAKVQVAPGGALLRFPVHIPGSIPLVQTNITWSIASCSAVGVMLVFDQVGLIVVNLRAIGAIRLKKRSWLQIHDCVLELGAIACQTAVGLFPTSIRQPPYPCPSMHRPMLSFLPSYGISHVLEAQVQIVEKQDGDALRRGHCGWAAGSADLVCATPLVGSLAALPPEEMPLFHRERGNGSPVVVVEEPGSPPSSDRRQAWPCLSRTTTGTSNRFTFNRMVASPGTEPRSPAAQRIPLE